MEYVTRVGVLWPVGRVKESPTRRGTRLRSRAVAIGISGLIAAGVAASPAAAGRHPRGGLPDAELFATKETAVITDPADPRLGKRLYGFARKVTRVIAMGDAIPRHSQLLDGVFFSSILNTTTFERSRRFDVDGVTGRELEDIADAIRQRFRQQSVLTFDYLRPRSPKVDAIELEVPGVTAQALRNGMLTNRAARERLQGGSVTLDARLILVADLADARLARAFAERIGGDLSHAVVRYGARDFVD
jgi:hypothetical protein